MEKFSRSNHSLNKKMAEAVAEWDAQGGKKGPLYMAKFASSKGLKRTLFWAYARSNVAKKRKPGSQMGKVPLLSKAQSNFLCQVVICADQANEGLTPSQVVANLQKMNPNINERTVRNHYQRTFLPKHKEQLKQRPMKEQKTLSKQSQCTVALQYR